MAITNGYATLAEYKNYHIIENVKDADDFIIEILIEAASRYIDRETQRTFYTRTQTRKYSVPHNTNNDRLLWLDDDLLSITTLTNGDTNTIAATEYNLLPVNDTPYYGIELKEASSTFWKVDSSDNSDFVIQVAGTWGYATAVPTDIKLACLQITRGAYGRRHGENVDGIASVTAAGVVITPQDVSKTSRETLTHYRRVVNS